MLLLKKEHSDISIFINNAGTGFSGKFEKVNFKNFEKTINLNCLAFTRMNYFAIKFLKTIYLCTK